MDDHQVKPDFQGDYEASGRELTAEEWLNDLQSGDDSVGALAQLLAETYEGMGRPQLTPSIWRQLAALALHSG